MEPRNPTHDDGRPRRRITITADEHLTGNIHIRFEEGRLTAGGFLWSALYNRILFGTQMNEREVRERIDRLVQLGWMKVAAHG